MGWAIPWGFCATSSLFPCEPLSATPFPPNLSKMMAVARMPVVKAMATKSAARKTVSSDSAWCAFSPLCPPRAPPRQLRPACGASGCPPPSLPAVGPRPGLAGGARGHPERYRISRRQLAAALQRPAPERCATGARLAARTVGCCVLGPVAPPGPKPLGITPPRAPRRRREATDARSPHPPRSPGTALTARSGSARSPTTPRPTSLARCEPSQLSGQLARRRAGAVRAP